MKVMGRAKDFFHLEIHNFKVLIVRKCNVEHYFFSQQCWESLGNNVASVGTYRA